MTNRITGKPSAHVTPPSDTALTEKAYQQGAVRPVSPAQPAGMAHEGQSKPRDHFKPALGADVAEAVAGLQSALEESRSQEQERELAVVALSFGIIQQGGVMDEQGFRLLEALVAHHKSGDLLDMKVTEGSIAKLSVDAQAALQPYSGKSPREIVREVGGDLSGQFDQRVIEAAAQRAQAERALKKIPPQQLR